MLALPVNQYIYDCKQFLVHSNPESAAAPALLPAEFGPLLLEIGTSLLQSGAGSKRVSLTLHRLASATSFQPHVGVAPRAVTVTLNNEAGSTLFSATHAIAAQGVNFRIISGISRLSWDFTEQQMTVAQARAELNRLRQLPHYHRALTLLVVALAGAAFCFTFGGSWQDMLVTGCATLAGLLVKQELVKKQFNPFIVTFISAWVAASLTGLLFQWGWGHQLEYALATCVLFLVPGVPLINGFTDLVDGYILNGLDRGINAVMHAMAIAFGLVLTIKMMNLH